MVEAMRFARKKEAVRDAADTVVEQDIADGRTDRGIRSDFYGKDRRAVPETEEKHHNCDGDAQYATGNADIGLYGVLPAR